jgi:predicted nucleic acid-binding protein
MKSLYLDTNILISLLDPVDSTFMRIIDQLKQGGGVMTNSIACHEFVRGPLTEQDRMRVRKILQGQIHACSRTQFKGLRLHV